MAVLMAIGLMALLVVTFFSQATLNRQISFSSSGQMRAGIIAQTAVDAVVGDLLDEIEASSTHPAGSSTIYLPVAGAFMPSQSGVSNALNVLKISSADPFRSGGGPGRASSIPTTTPASNGRYIDTNRWSAPALSPNLSAVPNWIYVERTGIATNGAALPAVSVLANPAATNPSYAVGRFAYIVYDEGAGLDVNVAGHHASGNVPSALDLANRGNEGFADLTQIGLTPSQIDALINVRNPSSGASGALYLNYLLGLDTNSVPGTGSYIPITNAAAPRYGDAAGFMTNFPGDQNFVGRMDFLKFASDHGITDPAVLASLTTFTREKNAPIPALPPGAMNGGKTNFYSAANGATNSAVIPVGKIYADIPVYPAAATINSTNTYSGVKLFTDLNVHVQAGDPILRRRFPLDRLQWLGPAGPANGASDADVLLAFGLQWDSAHAVWLYPSQLLSAQSGGIMDLKEVAAQNRDPNFFELLMAGFKYQTLGQAAFPSGFQTATRYFQDLNTSLHVLRIGANIIDQADGDGIPARIRFVTAPGPQSVAVTNDVYGIENLPYPSRMVFFAQRDLLVNNVRFPSAPQGSQAAQSFVPGVYNVSPATFPPLQTANTYPNTRYISPWVRMWFGFEMWNPNQLPPTPATADTPTSFRVIMANDTLLMDQRAGFTSTGSAAYSAGEYLYNAASPSDLRPLANGWNGTFSMSDAAPLQYFRSDYLDANVDYIHTGAIPVAGSLRPVALSTKVASEVDFSPGGVNSNFREPIFLMSNRGASSPNSDDKYNTLVGISAGKIFTPDIAYNPNQPNGSPELMRGGGNSGQPLFPPYIADPVAYPDPGTDPSNNDAIVSNWTIFTAFGGGVNFPSGTFLFQYKPAAGGSWINYNTLEGEGNANGNYSMTAPVANAAATAIPLSDNQLLSALRADPRVPRFNTAMVSAGSASTTVISTNYGQFPLEQPIWPPSSTAPTRLSGNAYMGSTNSFGTNTWNQMAGYNAVTAAPLGAFAINDSGQYVSYTDGDGVTRPADYYYGGTSPSLNSTPYAPNSSFSPLAVNLERPVVLNRPFRSSAELGYVNRDLPWRSIDFAWNNAKNADTALLDYFTASDSPVVAGRVSGATRNPLVWQALLSGAAIDPLYATNSGVNGTISATMAASLATAITNYVGTNVLTNKSDLVVQIPLSTAPSAWTVALTGGSYPKNAAFQREAAVRALSETLNTRTWNLMIDVIAQSGRLQVGATGLNQFVVEGERRYWLHIAIDRYTKQVIDRYLEPIYE